MTDEGMADQDDQVRDLAYRLWEDAGRPENRRDEFWYEARQRLARSGELSCQPTPPEPADPHPADENPSNVYNPAPGVRAVSEQHSTDLESDPHNPGSPA
jgi:hypothetical protein